MEIKYGMEFSNDPRYVIRKIKTFSGDCYYANHYEKIIRDGKFSELTDKLNGYGTLINYSYPLQICIGKFVNDIPAYPYITITPFKYYITSFHKINFPKYNSYENISYLDLRPKSAKINSTRTNLIKTNVYCKAYKNYINITGKTKKEIYINILVYDNKLLSYKEMSDEEVYELQNRFSKSIGYYDIFN